MPGGTRQAPEQIQLSDWPPTHTPPSPTITDRILALLQSGVLLGCIWLHFLEGPLEGKVWDLWPSSDQEKLKSSPHIITTNLHPFCLWCHDHEGLSVRIPICRSLLLKAFLFAAYSEFMTTAWGWHQTCKSLSESPKSHSLRRELSFGVNMVCLFCFEQVDFILLINFV